MLLSIFQGHFLGSLLLYSFVNVALRPSRTHWKKVHSLFVHLLIYRSLVESARLSAISFLIYASLLLAQRYWVTVLVLAHCYCPSSFHPYKHLHLSGFNEYHLLEHRSK